VCVGGTCGGRRARHVLRQPRERHATRTAGSVGEAVRQPAGRARVEAQSRSPDRVSVGHWWRIEVASDVLIDRKRRARLSGHHRTLHRVPALSLRPTGDSVWGEPAQERGAGSRRDLIGVYLDFDPLSVGRLLEIGTAQAVLVKLNPSGGADYGRGLPREIFGLVRNRRAV